MAPIRYTYPLCDLGHPTRRDGIHCKPLDEDAHSKLNPVFLIRFENTSPTGAILACNMWIRASNPFTAGKIAVESIACMGIFGEDDVTRIAETDKRG